MDVNTLFVTLFLNELELICLQTIKIVSNFPKTRIILIDNYHLLAHS